MKNNKFSSRINAANVISNWWKTVYSREFTHKFGIDLLFLHSNTLVILT